jgi:hypothetical protein
VPSDAYGIVAPEVGNDLCSNRPLPVVRPETAEPGGLSVSGGDMASVFGGTGRPSSEESERRRREFVRLVIAGTPFAEAARASRIKPLRALSILDAPEMRQIIGQAAA